MCLNEALVQDALVTHGAKGLALPLSSHPSFDFVFNLIMLDIVVGHE